MNIQQVYEKYRNKHNPPTDKPVPPDPYSFTNFASGYPQITQMAGCCSAVVMSGFFSKVPEDFGEYIDDVIDAYKSTHGLIIAIVLQSQMRWGEIFKERGWEESSAVSRSNYDKGNLMRVFIKTLRPVTQEDIIHSEAKQNHDNIARDKATKLQEEYQAARQRGEQVPVPAGYYATPTVLSYYEGCTCSMCKKAKEKETKEKEKAA
jgi:hypothetical protein